ncbi:hypothetical protein J2752_000140 [Halarchaeum rubridurum]|uniref:Uncharacterized protein n=1 Tax=Halarchaeum rubridurum TaxID=489911 RepID=A0A830FPH3_9EURY|nr:hypothetical protein [Halarchaeum rubridurum]MBP1953259.1 hypothetical protein [Halarchaeum rubridurum]GGM66682.1 hypothetical protein GCM10009017_15950 [Halarchaeum rubridurum]
MVAFTLIESVRMGGYALATLGMLLVFLEFFQQPSYVSYDPEFENYNVDISPQSVREHTWIGRLGALFAAAGFAVEFLAFFL